MAMTQDDIRRHYEQNWQTVSDSTAADGSGAASLVYSSPIEDRVLYPIYQAMIRDLAINTRGAVLDIGCGSGRWVRFFANQVPHAPREIVGIDFTQAAIDLLNKWRPETRGTLLRFQRSDITDPALSTSAIGGPDSGFDLINIANVLFHIPEEEKFRSALTNLRRLVAPAGHIVTTEYLPRSSMRSEWMRIRSRYEFEAAAEAAGLRIVDIRATGFFCNDPAGLDGPDQISSATPGTRQRFARVRAMQQKLLSAPMDDRARAFFSDLLVAIEEAALAFCRERIAAVDAPSQKLVVLARAG